MDRREDWTERRRYDLGRGRFWAEWGPEMRRVSYEDAGEIKRRRRWTERLRIANGDSEERARRDLRGDIYLRESGRGVGALWVLSDTSHS
ncbi:hypothetical protein TNIN_291621 [Trichonephila inaurata madagascariensis]|uniref:Uncharacterized protein n=1 Tax=Trichonephila inaurata madagascariensis TaxID=2747483 RepID=A0A8X7BS40_9ARAC|nr:hypothetical protein TNIN_291621 [Trichonephila inaurata madagascariensis]